MTDQHTHVGEATKRDQLSEAQQAACALADGADPIDWVRQALALRDHGKLEAAKDVLAAVIAQHEHIEAGYYELAFICRLQQDHRRAVNVLDRAIENNAVSNRLRVFRGHMLHAVGAHDEANAVLNQATPINRYERDNLSAMFKFGAYLQRFPVGRALVMHDRIQRSRRWLDTAELSRRIGEAIQTGTPFALVRLGDGEGGMVRISAEDEATFAALYDRNRSELIQMWFGPSFEWRDGPFLQQAQSLPSALLGCDVIGVPYESWIKHEYGISSQRGVPSLVNIYRLLEQYDGLASKMLCSQQAHIDLYREGGLVGLIQAAGHITVISCLPELAPLLRERLCLDDVALQLIPAEEGSRHLLGSTAGTGVHYPATFERIQAELAVPQRGRLFLVAGGLLGKFYCATIRAHGGIALDIGSLADSWVGRATRPGYDKTLKL